MPIRWYITLIFWWGCLIGLHTSTLTLPFKGLLHGCNNRVLLVFLAYDELSRKMNAKGTIVHPKPKLYCSVIRSSPYYHRLGGHNRYQTIPQGCKKGNITLLPWISGATYYDQVKNKKICGDTVDGTFKSETKTDLNIQLGGKRFKIPRLQPGQTYLWHG